MVISSSDSFTDKNNEEEILKLISRCNDFIELFDEIKEISLFVHRFSND